MEAGKKLNGRYKVKKPVGTGGMANVYLAHDLILDRDVAVKVLRYDFRDDEDTIRRFKREALAATELVHPNIVGIYDVGEEDHNQYIVMEYVKGMDLKQYIQNHYPIAYPKVINIMEQILSAVEYAHQNRIIHRDLKPQNILIDENDVIKITDFGIAVAVSQSSITQTNSLLGSVHYLSPEQARGGMATNQSDIYSLGIILYELLIGKVPFEGESAVSIALKHFQEPIPSVKKIDHLIPQPLENVVLKATAKETADRYKSVREMAEDLETALSPERSAEAPFMPVSMQEDTKVLTPIDTQTHQYDGDAVPITSEKDLEQPTEKKTAHHQGQSLKKKPKKKKRKLMWFLLAIAAMLIVFVSLLILLSPKDVTVPNIEGLTEEKAKETLTQANLAVEDVSQEPNEKIAEELAIRTDPAAGASVKEKTTVLLYVSSGKKTVAFKDYVGESYEETRAALTDLGFTVEQQQESSETVPEGVIISQDIEEDNEVIPSETTVTLTVSTGKRGIKMRDLDGYSQKGVEDYANENGLELSLTQEHSEDIPSGYVISQSIEAGKIFYKGDSLSVVLSLGPKEVPVERFNITVSIPYQETKETAEEGDSDEEKSSEESKSKENQIEIYLEDEQNSIDNIYQQFSIDEDTDTVLSFTLKEGETGRYRIVRDGEVIEEKANIQPESDETNDEG